VKCLAFSFFFITSSSLQVIATGGLTHFPSFYIGFYIFK